MSCPEERFVRLERQNRVLLIVCSIIVVATLLGWTTTPDLIPDIVQAERFQLVDADGLVRGELRMNEDGPALVLFDEDGNERVDLFHNAEATALYLRDANGQPRVGTARFSHGGGGFALHGPEGVGASVLYMQGTGPGRLSFYDSTGTVFHQFPTFD